ncbi:MAG: hypothetical protein GXY48_15040 [Methanomicrobiales archaeon]|nr:hypothetical protein [Methanomicrobiales archaeon]
MDNNRLGLIIVLFLCGLVLSLGANFIMEIHTPVRQQSTLLENYLIMQSMAGKNASYANQTYMIGDSGIVVSFNDILNIRDNPAQDTKRILGPDSPLTLPKVSNTTIPGVLSGEVSTLPPLAIVP